MWPVWCPGSVSWAPSVRYIPNMDIGLLSCLGTCSHSCLLPQLLQGAIHCCNFICHLCIDKRHFPPCALGCWKGEKVPLFEESLTALSLDRLLQAGRPLEEVRGGALSSRAGTANETKWLGFLSMSLCSEWKIHMDYSYKQSSSQAST